MADTPLDAALDAALALVEDEGWMALSLAEVAARADLSPAELHRLLPSKEALLEALLRRTDDQVYERLDPDLGRESPRDRLFEVLMLRFDALKPMKPAVAAMLRDLARDPVGMAAALPAFGRSLAAMLEAAGLSSTGMRGLMRVNGLGLAYVAAMRAWMADDSQDLSATMAELDRRLGQLGGLARRLAPLARLFGMLPMAAADGGSEIGDTTGGGSA